MSKLFSDMLNLLKDDYFPRISSQTTTGRCAPPEVRNKARQKKIWDPGNRELNSERKTESSSSLCSSQWPGEQSIQIGAKGQSPRREITQEKTKLTDSSNALRRFFSLVENNFRIN